MEQKYDERAFLFCPKAKTRDERFDDESKKLALKTIHFHYSRQIREKPRQLVGQPPNEPKSPKEELTETERNAEVGGWSVGIE